MPGRDSEKLLYFMKALLGKSRGLDWISTDKIDKIYKINNDKTIVVTAGKNFFLLSLNDEKNRVNLISDGMIIKQFIAKTENGKLYMYVLEKIYGKIIEMGQKFNNLTPEEENEKIAKQLIAFKEKQKKLQEKNEIAFKERQKKLEEQNKKKKKNHKKSSIL